MNDWIEYITLENEAYNPATQLMILSTITSDLKQDTNNLPPALNKRLTADTLNKILITLNVDACDLFNFRHNQDKENLKQELLKAINNETVDINLMYRFYEAIK